MKKRMSGCCTDDESVQNMEDKPWTHEVKTLEGALARLEEGDLEKASRLVWAEAGGCEGFHPKVLELTKAELDMAAASVYEDVPLDSEECYQ